MTKVTTAFKLALSGAAVFAASSTFAPPAQAAIEYPWCVLYGAGMGGGSARNCGFVSYEQCMMTARGDGGWCEKNSFYPGEIFRNREQPPRTR
jgi:hypothetical protein